MDKPSKEKLQRWVDTLAGSGDQAPSAIRFGGDAPAVVSTSEELKAYLEAQGHKVMLPGATVVEPEPPTSTEEPPAA